MAEICVDAASWIALAWRAKFEATQTEASEGYAGNVVIARAHDQMTLRMGERWCFELRCFDVASLQFIYQTTGENAVGPSGIQLIMDASGVVRVHDDWLDSNGLGLGVIERRKG